MRLLFFWLAAAFMGMVNPCFGQYATLDPKDVEFKAESIGVPTLPYQALAIRFSLRNVSNHKLGPLPSGIIGGIYAFKGPIDGDYKESQVRLPFERFHHRNVSVPSALEHLLSNEKFTFFLNSGEKISFSAGFGERTNPQNQNRVLPAFAVPGTYFLKCGYTVDVKKQKIIYDYVEVKVLEPQGTDLQVYQLLKKDKFLAWELMRPLLDPPGDEIFPKVKKLVEDFPNSSYAPYAHLALARCYLTGKANLSGYRVPFPASVTLGDKAFEGKSIRVPMAMAADELEKAYNFPPFDPKSKQDFNPNLFPFRPQALAIQAHISSRDSPNCILYLHRDHRDSLQWIHLFAEVLLSLSGRQEAFTLEGMIPGFPNPKTATPEEIWRWFRTQ